ncbi:MAG: hypothetical protein OES24_21840, partial [Acidimicrobiia bacterium]|nr:hypothetical protein [Acidimicrobiia bacterium]
GADRRKSRSDTEGKQENPKVVTSLASIRAGRRAPDGSETWAIVPVGATGPENRLHEFAPQTLHL